jgi:hypothetical protein
MENMNRAGVDTLTDKMKVYLDVFGALMLHRVGQEVDCTHIITIDKCGMLQRLA